MEREMKGSTTGRYVSGAADEPNVSQEDRNEFRFPDHAVIPRSVAVFDDSELVFREGSD
jgi:hypothetical protein